MKMKMKYLFLCVTVFLALTGNAQTSKTSTTKKPENHAHTTRYQCPMKCEGEKMYDHEGKCPVCNMNLKAKSVNTAATSYYCPMKCEGDKTYAEAGKCPVCNMDLKQAKAKKQKAKAKNKKLTKSNTHTHS
jgi:hypothetical protein